MRQLIVSEFVTLDGVMEAPGGEPGHPHSGWVFEYQGPEQIAYKHAEVLAAGILLIGRVTYESFAEAWPTRTGEFADMMNAMPKAVVSSTLTDPTWNNTTVLRGDVVEAVTRLKNQPAADDGGGNGGDTGDGGPILVAGSAKLVHTLLDNGLVDELRLMVFPVTIGAGLRVFPETTDKTWWKMSDTQTFPSLVRVDTYRPTTAGVA